MKFLPRFDGGFQDTKLNQVIRDIIQAFGLVLDYQVYQFDVFWSPPVMMNVPFGDRSPRLRTPSVVRVDRVVDTSDPTTPIAFGATHWVWQGNNTVQLTDVQGLVMGVNYRLSVSVVG